MSPSSLDLQEPRFAVLGSGSAANAYVFELGDFAIMIDNGYSLNEFRRRMKTLKFDEKKIQFIFLTHLHSDHFKGVEALALELDIPVVTHRDMPIHAQCKKTGMKILDIIPGENYEFGPLKFRPFRTSHDAACSLGFYFKLGNKVISLITDTGIVTPEMETLALRSDYLFLESNYSPTMLHQGPYPRFLKQRILSDVGHLSNLDAAAFMARLIENEKNRIVRFFLCHLSEKNNSVERVEDEISSIYQGDTPYYICPRNEAIPFEDLIP